MPIFTVGSFPTAELVITSLDDKDITWKIIAERIDFKTFEQGVITLRVTQRNAVKAKLITDENEMLMAHERIKDGLWKEDLDTPPSTPTTPTGSHMSMPGTAVGEESSEAHTRVSAAPKSKRQRTSASRRGASAAAAAAVNGGGDSSTHSGNSEGVGGEPTVGQKGSTEQPLPSFEKGEVVVRRNQKHTPVSSKLGGESKPSKHTTAASLSMCSKDHVFKEVDKTMVKEMGEIEDEEELEEDEGEMEDEEEVEDEDEEMEDEEEEEYEDEESHMGSTLSATNEEKGTPSSMNLVVDPISSSVKEGTERNGTTHTPRQKKTNVARNGTKRTPPPTSRGGVRPPRPRPPRTTEKRCDVPSCTKFSRGGKTLTQDAYAGPGARCLWHGGFGTCSAMNCKNAPVARTSRADGFGEPGPRCPRHGGGRQCNVTGCTTSSRRNVASADKHGPPGGRCYRHGGGRKHVTNAGGGGKKLVAAQHAQATTGGIESTMLGVKRRQSSKRVRLGTKKNREVAHQEEVVPPGGEPMEIL